MAATRRTHMPRGTQSAALIHWGFGIGRRFPPSIPDSIYNPAVGIADAASLGIGPLARKAFGIQGPNTCSAGYQAGQAAGIIGGFLTGEGELNLTFKTGHYAADLIAQGVSVADAEAAVAAHIAEYAESIEGWTQAQVTVDGTVLNYRVSPVPGGGLNVGTIYTRW